MKNDDYYDKCGKKNDSRKLSDHTSVELKAALDIALSREMKEDEERSAKDKTNRLKRIAELKEELEKLESPYSTSKYCEHEWQHAGGNRWCNKCGRGV
jgi:hypothetical protein